jgi:hypothetical protein
VLRRNPLKLPPYLDPVFNRISRADYGFLYRNRQGALKLWYPQAEELVKTVYYPEDVEDFDFTVVERIEFLPSQPEISHDQDDCRVLNLWRPPGWTIDASAAEPTPFLEHVSYLLDGNGEAIEHVLSFFAHMLQRPQERVGHALLIMSEAKGIGKSTLGNIVRGLVGERNSRVVQTKDLKGQFDGWLMGKILVQVDEVYEAGNWDLANKLKPIITERTVSVNVKYGPQLEVENFARFLMFSNHTAPLNIEDGDRRYFVFNSKAQVRDQSYYDALHRYLDHAALNAIYSFLMRRDLSTFSPYRVPPMTEAKQAVIDVSGHPLRAYIMDAVQSGHFETELAGRVFSLDALQRQLHKDGYGPQAKNVKELSDALQAAGVTKRRQRLPDGSRPCRWELPASERHSGANDGRADFPF